jgi:AraC family transcriptional regulator
MTARRTSGIPVPEKGHGSFAEFYLLGPYGGYVRGQRNLGSFAATLTEIEQPRGDFPDDPTPDLVLATSLRSGVRVTADQGAGRFGGVMECGDLVLAPPNTQTQITLEGANQFLALSLPYQRVLESLEDDRQAADFDCLHSGPFRDEVVAALIRRLWSEAGSGAAGSLFLDGAISTLLGALITTAGSRRDSTRHSRGGLAPWQLRRVQEYLAEHLEQDLTLRELAQLAGLSENHFCTAFRSSTGEPPHRYLTRLRIDRAKQMLGTPTLSVTEIGLAVGFGSSAHFATVFRKREGTTPSEYRRRYLS